MKNYLKELENLKKKENTFLDLDALANMNEWYEKAKSSLKDQKRITDTDLEDFVAINSLNSDESVFDDIRLFLKEKEDEYTKIYNETKVISNYINTTIVRVLNINDTQQEFRLTFDESLLNYSKDQITSSLFNIVELFVQEILRMKHDRIFTPFSNDDINKYQKSAEMPALSKIKIDDIVEFLKIYKEQRPDYVSKKEDKLSEILISK